MAPISPTEWSLDQRAAVAADLDQQLLDVIERLVRLSRDLVAEASVAEPWIMTVPPAAGARPRSGVGHGTGHCPPGRPV